jgi:inhibitor of KinA sporulation pathway (predicted exonuclease)
MSILKCLPIHFTRFWTAKRWCGPGSLFFIGIGSAPVVWRIVFRSSLAMQTTNDYYLIVDVEATCSDDASVPRQEMEIIEIGAVMQNARTFEVESEFRTFVRPLRHAQLTDFCTVLTGIAQVDVADAPGFPEAMDAMKKWAYAYDDSLFSSWGDYDRKQFMQDCGYHRIAYPFRSGHKNLKAAFTSAMSLSKKCGIEDALCHLGLDFEGSHHRGLDDARNIARIVRCVCLGPSGLSC